jgi:hypothetical protein
MLGDAFVPGALVLAHSLRRVGTARALVCMVTPDVSQGARGALAELFDHVREVPYIAAPTAPLPTEKQRKLYPWINRAYTKWNCLGLVQWRRVIFVDADMCFAENADELFELPAPAGCFCSAWLEAESPYLRWWRQRHPSAAELPHGAVLPPALLLGALASPTFTVIAALVSLNTDRGAVGRFRAFLEAGAPYGARHRVRGSGADETSIVEFAARAGQPWRHIHPRYEAIPRKPGWGTGAGAVKAWHFHGGDKPWAVAPGTWPDLALWWAEAERARQAHPGLAGWLREPAGGEPPAGGPGPRGPQPSP